MLLKKNVCFYLYLNFLLKKNFNLNFIIIYIIYLRIIILFFIFIKNPNLLFDFFVETKIIGVAFCQDIDNLSDEQFNIWLENADTTADRLNLNFVRTKSYYKILIENDLNYLIRSQSLSYTITPNLLYISNSIVSNSKALVFNQIVSKYFFMEISMNATNQVMPVEMYIDSLENLVLGFNRDWVIINSAQTLLINSNNILLEENLLKMDQFKNIIINNVTELQQHSNSINFNNLYNG